MSIATARIAGAAGMTMAGTPTMFTIRVSQASGMTFELPLAKTSGSSITVDWGDGTIEVFSPSGTDGWTGAGQLSHPYSDFGDYVVTLDRGLEYVGFGFFYGGQPIPGPTMLLSIVQWGENLFPDSLWEDTQLQQAESSGLTLFANCSNLEGPLPSPVRPLARICAKMFYRTAKLADPSPLIGPDTVIDDYAFLESGVTGTSWWPSSADTVPSGCFRDATRLADLSGLAGVLWAKDAAFKGCTSLVSLAGLASDNGGRELYLEPSCFEGCTGLTSLATLPRSVFAIPKWCFAGCVGLQTEGIRIPRQIQQIGAYAFADVGASEIVFGETVEPDGSVSSADQAHPMFIDQSAFIGQASAPAGGPRPKLIAPHLSPSDFRGIEGTDALGGVPGGGSRGVTVTYDVGSTSTSYSWFTIAPTHMGAVPVSWAPWGVGSDWQIVTSVSQDTPHADVICELFVGSTSGDVYVPENLRNRNYGTSSLPADWRTRLEVLQMIRPYVAQSPYAASFDFSPYADLRPQH